MAFNIQIEATPERIVDRVYSVFEEMLTSNPAAVLGLATGGTPAPLYDRLVQAFRDGKLSFEKASSFNLDEYVGLSGDHAQSYRFFMREALFDHVDIDQSKTYFPDTDGADLRAAGRAYDALIEQSGGIDLQLLGLGRNGHIGFNEPGTPFDEPSGPRDLAHETLQDNKRFFGNKEAVPALAISMGINTILKAREIVVMVVGEAKAEALRALVSGPVSADNPASALRDHQNVTVFADAAAASLLDLQALGALEAS